MYIDKKKIKGVNVDDPQIKEKIYNQYLEAYKKGVYSYIKADYDPSSRKNVRRQYHSGGFDGKRTSSTLKVEQVKPSFFRDHLRKLKNKGSALFMTGIILVGVGLTNTAYAGLGGLGGNSRNRNKTRVFFKKDLVKAIGNFKLVTSPPGIIKYIWYKKETRWQSYTFRKY